MLLSWRSQPVLAACFGPGRPWASVSDLAIAMSAGRAVPSEEVVVITLFFPMVKKIEPCAWLRTAKRWSPPYRVPVVTIQLRSAIMATMLEGGADARRRIRTVAGLGPPRQAREYPSVA
jgi:hypothetical protein